MNENLSPNQQKYTESKHPLKLYKELLVGEEKSFLNFWFYEIFYFIANACPGIIGIFARNCVFKLFLKKQQGLSYFGKNVEIKSPSKVSIGKKVFFQDYVLVDSRGKESFIDIKNFAFLGRYSILLAKNAKITLEEGVNIGSFCRIATQSKILIKKGTLISSYCYIGPGNHKKAQGEGDAPRISQGMEIKGGVEIGENCWIGANVTILDGVKIGDNAIIGAHAFVNKDVPANSVYAGVPAKEIKKA